MASDRPLTSPYRVLLVVSSMDTGGVEQYIVNVLRALDRDRFEVTIACTRSVGDWYRAELDALGVSLVYCPNPYSQVGFVRRVKRLMSDLRIHVVCDFRSGLAGSTMFAAWLARVRSRIAECRNTGVGYQRSFLRDRYMDVMKFITKRFATRVLANSSQVLDVFDPFWQRRPELYGVVANGVDTTKFQPADGAPIRETLGIPPDAVVVGHVGRFHPVKNHVLLIEAFSRLREIVPDVWLLLVGDGNLRAEIERKVETLGVPSRVTLTGVRRDVPELLRAMDVFFFPSRYEGLPNALIEAMACELPVVASNRSEIADVVPEEFAPRLHHRDDVESFVRSLAELCVDPGERARLGRLGRARVVDRFSIESSAALLSAEWIAPLRSE